MTGMQVLGTGTVIRYPESHLATLEGRMTIGWTRTMHPDGVFFTNASTFCPLRYCASWITTRFVAGCCSRETTWQKGISRSPVQPPEALLTDGDLEGVHPDLRQVRGGAHDLVDDRDLLLRALVVDLVVVFVEDEDGAGVPPPRARAPRASRTEPSVSVTMWMPVTAASASPEASAASAASADVVRAHPVLSISTPS